MVSEEDIQAVAADAEAMERYPRAGIEALRDELADALRARLAGIGWRGEIRIEDDPYEYAFEPGYRGFTLSTDTWDGPDVQMPGVPLEVVRTASGDGPWSPLREGEHHAWELLLKTLVDDAAMWEMYWPNMLAFLDDVGAQGGPRLGRGALEVDVDGSGFGTESYMVTVPGGRIHVGMHGDAAGRASDEPVFVEGYTLTWQEAVAAFIRVASEITG